jgi:hypothetical protein
MASAAVKDRSGRRQLDPGGIAAGAGQPGPGLRRRPPAVTPDQLQGAVASTPGGAAEGPSQGVVPVRVREAEPGIGSTSPIAGGAVVFALPVRVGGRRFSVPSPDWIGKLSRSGNSFGVADPGSGVIS